MRFCAPWLGRWISADPAGLVDGPNLYLYVNNNPINSIDPDGQQSTAAAGNQAGDMIQQVIDKFTATAERVGSAIVKVVRSAKEILDEFIASKEQEILRLLNADPKYLTPEQKKETMALLNVWADRTFVDQVFSKLEDRGPGIELLPIGTDEFEIGGRNRQPNFVNPSHRNDYAQPTHTGNDIFAKRGQPVLSPVTGRIVEINGVGNEPPIGKGGKFVFVQRGNHIYYMAHLDTVANFKVGDIVFAGTQLGTVGNTGSKAKGTSPHIHFEISVKRKSDEIDPFPHLMKHIGIGLIDKVRNLISDIRQKPEARDFIKRSVESFIDKLNAAANAPPAPQTP
jgi:murein DD-endopeptidase MepM/ murein hydrolase activator NlpD